MFNTPLRSILILLQRQQFLIYTIFTYASSTSAIVRLKIVSVLLFNFVFIQQTNTEKNKVLKVETVSTRSYSTLKLSSFKYIKVLRILTGIRDNLLKKSMSVESITIFVI